MLSRRQLLLATGALAVPGARASVRFAEVTPRPLVFPADFGAHPDFRIEWWYLTGWLGDADRPLGFQVTFFRVRTDIDTANPSPFTARQLVIAHAALADPARGTLLVDERIARAGFGLVEAGIGDTDVRIDGWSLARDAAADAYRAVTGGREFGLRFTAAADGPPWLQGDAGVSGKGPLAAQASHYYSRPRLRVEAEVLVAGSAPRRLRGIAWLDHEWSSTALAPEAAGWDWLGMNLDDGSALLAFQVRRNAKVPDTFRTPPGEVPDTFSVLQRYAAFREPGGRTRVVDPATVHFTPLRYWQSPRSGASWPVAQRIDIGDRSFETEPLMPDQELDSRRTTGAIYWEGASTLLEAGRPAGRGYLEMTGYARPIEL